MLNGILLAASRDSAVATQTKGISSFTLQLRGNLIRSVHTAINGEGPAVRDETIAALLSLAFDEVRCKLSNDYNNSLNTFFVDYLLMPYLRRRQPGTGKLMIIMPRR
jgi:hypothetical protein